MAQVQKCMGRATRIVTGARLGSQAVAAFYHDTCVARREGSVVKLESGGYRTATTKLRMNQFSNEFCNGAFKVYQEKGEWYVYITKENGLGEPISHAIDFRDGMEFSI